MIVYSVIMFVVAAVLAVFSVLIAKGNANLINSYREERVKDKALYCKKISHALFIIAGTLVCCGTIVLFGEADGIVLLSLGVLVVGMVFGVVQLFRAQKKYGGGVF